MMRFKIPQYKMIRSNIVNARSIIYDDHKILVVFNNDPYCKLNKIHLN